MQNSLQACIRSSGMSMPRGRAQVGAWQQVNGLPAVPGARRPSLRAQRPCTHRNLLTRSADIKDNIVTSDDGGTGGNGNNGNDGNGRGDGRGDDGDDDKLIGLDEAAAIAAAAGVTLPKDFLATAAADGIRLGAVQRFIALQSTLLAGWLCRVAPWFRDRLLYDDRFLFKVGAEIIIDSGCATVAEVRKRGDEFWDEFEFYLSDLLVGLVMDVVLVGLMAPTAVLGASRPAGKTGLQRALDKVPSAVFEASQKGRVYSPAARAACVGVKFLEYSLAGMFCGLVGQAVANAAMMARRAHNPDASYTVEPPPLLKTALVWGLFMGVSSNLRYQAVFGLERVVDLTIAKKIPQIAYGSTIAIRFVNNIVGGENFIDMARFFGVQ